MMMDVPAVINRNYKSKTGYLQSLSYGPFSNSLLQHLNIENEAYELVFAPLLSSGKYYTIIYLENSKYVIDFKLVK